MRYRRDLTPGAAYFFTVVTEARHPVFADAAAVDVLRNAFRYARARHPFTLDAIVILPDHLHTVWTLPDGDADYSVRWNQLKGWFSKRWSAHAVASPARHARRERAIWQRRYWEHRIRDEHDLARHIDYIHWNPVKHGYASTAAEWPYSSFQTCVRRGLYPADWAAPEHLPTIPGPQA